MKFRTKQFGLTIIEALVGLAILAILITLTIGITTTVRDKGRQQLTEQTITLLNAALEEYYQFWGAFPLDKERQADANDVIDETYGITELEADLNGTISGASTDEWASIQGLYYCLNKTPKVREMISKIDGSLITSKATDKITNLYIKVNSKDYPLYRINNGWGIAFRYLYDREKDSFPRIE